MADKTESIEFERGDKVKHPKWGLGTVLYKSGSGEHGKVIVLFQEAGQKNLMVKYAKLEKVLASSGRGKLPDVEEYIEEDVEEEKISDLEELKEADNEDEEDL